MIDHFEIKTKRFERCKNFYTAVLRPLNIELKWSDEAAAGFGCTGLDKVGFLIEKSESQSSSPLHLAFTAADERSVKQFHQAGIAGGYTCNGKPGIREIYSPNYYAAFLFDPDGNNIEAVVYV